MDKLTIGKTNHPPSTNTGKFKQQTVIWTKNPYVTFMFNFSLPYYCCLTHIIHAQNVTKFATTSAPKTPSLITKYNNPTKSM